MTATKPLRLVVVMPSWMGDVVMATPALRLLRDELPGAFIGALVRPGMEPLLRGTDLVDEVHVDRASGVMGPKRVACKLRGSRYEAALLLANSFSSALVTRLAFIPRRVGYARDARSMLLTEGLRPQRRESGAWAPVSAVAYYLRAAHMLIGTDGAEALPERDLLSSARLELGITEDEASEARSSLEQAGVPTNDHDGYAVLNPGGNNEAKRWPAEGFASVATHLVVACGLRVVVNGSPGERDVVDSVVRGTSEQARSRVASLLDAGVTIGSLKEIVRGARVMVTNDTGPRHVAAAFGVPTVTLFGPTDPRWTRLPGDDGLRIDLSACPDLEEGEVADEHPERCRVERIGVERVIGAVDRLIRSGASRP